MIITGDIACPTERLSIQLKKVFESNAAIFNNKPIVLNFEGLIGEENSYLLGTLLAPYRVAGFNSAPFLGVSRAAADIFRIEFGTNTGRDFAINRGDLIRGVTEVPTTPSVPEPSSMALFGLALAGVVLARQRRSDPRASPVRNSGN